MEVLIQTPVLQCLGKYLPLKTLNIFRWINRIPTLHFCIQINDPDNQISSIHELNYNTLKWMDSVEKIGSGQLLLKSIGEEDDELTTYLLNLGLDINYVCPNTDNSALIAATDTKNLKLIQYLVDQGADLTHYNKIGNTPLLTAIVKDDLDMVKLLINLGSDPEYQFDKGQNALVAASMCGSETVAKYIIGLGVEINPRGGVSDSLALYGAITIGRVDMVKLLLQHGADPNARIRHGLQYKCPDEAQIEIIGELIVRGLDITDGYFLFRLVEKSAPIDLIKLAVQHGSPVDYNNHVKTSLHMACEQGNVELVEYLISQNSPIDFVNFDGDTELISTLRLIGNECTDECEELEFDLSDYLASPNEHSNTEQTSKNRQLAPSVGEKIIKLLIDGGADSNYVTRTGESPLYLACKSNNINIVRTILESGADPNEWVLEKYLLQHVCMSKPNQLNRLELVKLLIEFGAEVNLWVPYNESPLHLAINWNYDDVVKFLIENEAYVSDRDHKFIEIIEYENRWEIRHRLWI